MVPDPVLHPVAKRVPVRPANLGLVLGPPVEDNFVKSMIKSDGQLIQFFERPIAGGRGVVRLPIWLAPPVLWFRQQARRRQAAA